MFDFCYVHHKLPKHIFLASFITFIILNIVENIIHYNNGKFRESNQIYFDLPSKKDFIKMIVIMFIFAFLQGSLTLILSHFV
jgi:hypothetical protein